MVKLQFDQQIHIVWLLGIKKGALQHKNPNKSCFWLFGNIMEQRQVERDLNITGLLTVHSHTFRQEVWSWLKHCMNNILVM